ncbi:MAG: glycosyltransferase family 2 protein [Clostridiales Family XIII bacterium]|jgi:glycosyltransferase involved in cell wall biosynthesis|nr:glycosyltransferase family 2 protein [Clostridiales Family XIII bacterium]
MVSIIIIIKDTKEYLAKCLDSIKNQTLGDIQVIAVDDHSLESSEDIIALYQGAMKISYLNLTEERGPGGARNVGFQHATGEYICFLDSDDWLDLIYLETAEKLMSEHQADIGMCGLIRNYDSVAYTPVYKCSYQNLHILDGTTAFRMMSDQYDFGVTISPSPVSKIYLRTFLENNKIEFLENVYYEDVLFAFQTLLTDCKVITIPDVYYHHYRRPGSIVQSLSQRHFDDFNTVFTKVKEYLIESHQYEDYAFNYYKILERFYNLIIRQVFQFSKSEQEKKKWMQYSFSIIKELIVLEEYMEYFSAEDIRRHLQPFLKDTTLL